jgi:CRISPR-associated protein Csd2
MQPVENRYDFVLFFDVTNGNPNGDPDAGNLPRLDPETSQGLVTDVCLKRKVRNFVELAKENQAPYELYVRERGVLIRQHQRAHESLGKVEKKEDRIAQARAWMCQNFFDVRTFGAVMSLEEGGYNCGQVRGPAQLSFARSIDPIVPLDLSITRMAVATERESQAQEGDNRTMGRKSIVPYGLYRCHGFISAPLAQQTGFGEQDLELLWQALSQMFDHDHSSSRGEMATRKLVAFKHNSKLGNAPSHQLFDLVNVERATDPNSPPRSIEDYRITLNREGLPQGVTMQELI